MTRHVRSTFLVLVLSTGLFSHSVGAQTPPVQENIGQSSTTGPPEIELRGVVVLRISEDTFKSLFVRDIDKTSCVSLQVLGTRTRGTAHTVGTTDIETMPDQSNASFNLRVHGTSHSQTVGRNGSAIIYSRSLTTWQCDKVIRFQDLHFHSDPGTIRSETRIFPQGVSAAVRGLRGRLVERVARKRVRECLRQAEAITGRDAKRRVLADVNRTVDEKIALLNERIQTQPLVSILLPMLKNLGLELSSSSQCININILGGDDWPIAKVVPMEAIAPRDAELWLQSGLFDHTADDLSDAIDNLGTWLALNMPNVQIAGANSAIGDSSNPLPFDVEIDTVGEWVVLRTSVPRQSVQAIGVQQRLAPLGAYIPQ